MYNFEEFQCINENELNCIVSESGLDRELDFDQEGFILELFSNIKYKKLYNLKYSYEEIKDEI